MTDPIRALLDALDLSLSSVARAGERLDLYHIGRSECIMHYGLRGVMTQDVDILRKNTPLEARALTEFGKNTPNARALGVYLETVPEALPPVPSWFDGRCVEVAGGWKVIRLWRPEVHDLAATKMKSFRQQDRQDLRALCDAGLLHAEPLRASLEKAFLWTTEKDGDPDRDRAFANLERVCRYLEGEISTL